MSSDSSCRDVQRRRRRPSKKKGKADFCGRIRKDEGDVDRVSDSFPEHLISDSEALTSSEKKIMRRILRELYELPSMTESTSVAPLREKRKWEADLEDSSVVPTQTKKKNPIKEEENSCIFFDFADLEKCYENPRHPDLVKKDPEGKLIPKEIPGDPFGFLEVPPWVTCDVCGRPDHWRLCCPYLYDYPPTGGFLKNPDFYRVVCDCGNPDVDPPARGCTECVSGTGFHVERISHPSGDDDDDIEFDPWIPPDGDIGGNPIYIPERDPVQTYVPDL